MKFLFTILLVITSFSDLDKIARVNQVKKEAKEAYLNGDYETALSKYRYLTDSLEVIDDDIRLNMANAYYNLQDSAQAINNYSQLFDSKSRIVKSTAHQQMGVMSSKNKKFDEALDHFKEALKADPTNQDARYNYELMKKILKEQEEQEQEQQDQENKEENKDQEQQKQDQQNKDQEQKNEDQKKQEEQQEEQNKEGEGEEQEKDEEQKSEEQKKEEEGEPKEEEKPQPEEGEESEEKEGKEQKNPLSEKLEEMKISEEKARMILEALKNKEIQYYQQNKRKPTKRKDPKKPDW